MRPAKRLAERCLNEGECECESAVARSARTRGLGGTMNVVLFGASGMVGGGALLECLADPRVESVVTIGRSPTGRVHPKLREIVQPDLFHYDGLDPTFAQTNACFFCLGVSAVGLDEAEYS